MAHTASQWGVSLTNFGAPVYDSGSSPDLLSHVVATPLDYETLHYWRVRFFIDGAWEAYSTHTALTTEASFNYLVTGAGEQLTTGDGEPLYAA